MSAAHLTPSTTKGKRQQKKVETNRQTHYTTQCSSSSCGVVLLAGRCFWQVNGSSRSTGGWRILGEVHSFTKEEVTKAGTIHFTVQLQGMGVTVFNLHLVKFTVSFPKLTQGDLWGPISSLVSTCSFSTRPMYSRSYATTETKQPIYSETTQKEYSLITDTG